jgi:uncharacterized protein
MEDFHMEELITGLEKEVGEMFHDDGSCHDIYHLKRVHKMALHIQEKEGGDRTIIGVSAFLHDIHRVIQKKNGKFCSPKESLPMVSAILDRTKLSRDQKARILHCIEFHEEYSFSEEGKTVSDIETLIVQDADNLDAIGAIGIGRTFSYGEVRGIPMWISEKPFDRKVFDESIEDLSTIHHFHSKLLRLKDNMNTKTAKSMAEGRHRFMEIFLKEFLDEWNGRK